MYIDCFSAVFYEIAAACIDFFNVALLFVLIVSRVVFFTGLLTL